MLHRSLRSSALLLLGLLPLACDQPEKTGDAEQAESHGEEHDANAAEQADAEGAEEGSTDSTATADEADAGAKDASADAALSDAPSSTDGCDLLEQPFSRTGEAGIVVARFLSIEPALEYVGRYDWTLELTDAAGNALPDAELAAEAYMPGHGHGTSAITLEHETGSALHTLRDVNLFMSGKWEVRLTIETDAGQDYLEFLPCPKQLPDEEDADAAEL